MDWIEQLTGLSPDGGDGTAEAAIVLASVIVLVAVVAMRVPTLRERVRANCAAWITRLRDSGRPLRRMARQHRTTSVRRSEPADRRSIRRV
jgi:hypothetical protein